MGRSAWAPWAAALVALAAQPVSAQVNVPGRPATAAAPVVVPKAQIPPPPIVVAAPPAPAPELDFARPDPGVVMGVLPNGLRYAIYQRPSHGGESLHLRILAGSRDESPSELGAAHYLEHMAFDGSRGFPAGTLMKRFETAGIAAGHDQNAFTNYLNTTYVLDLPQVDAAKLDLSFQWLRDVADGLTLDAEAVDRERGVILSEYRLQRGPNWDSARALELFKLPYLRGPIRPPIGAEASLKVLSASDLRGFYRRWYRPEQAIIVAVGEAPAADIKARIESAFGNWRNASRTEPHPSDGIIGVARSTDVLTQSQPALAPYVQICRLRDREKRGPQSVATRRGELADLMWNEILNRRLLALRRADKPPFVAAAVERRTDYGVAAETCLNAAPLDHDWAGALAALETEARRFETYGPTPAELRDAQLEVIGGLNHAVMGYADAYPVQIGWVLLESLSEGVTYATPMEERRIQFRALTQIGPGAVKEAFRKRWGLAAAPMIAIQTPETVAQVDVKARWLTADAAPAPSPPVDEAHAAWAYAAFGEPGRVVERQEMPDPGFVRLKLSNGVGVNFKQTALAKGEVRIRIRFGAGTLELPPADSYAGQIAASVLMEGGFGKNTAEDLVRTCSGRSCNANLAIDRWSFALDGAVTSPRDLDLELELLTALLADPGFRPTMDLHIPTLTRAAYRQWSLTPMTTASFALSSAALPPRPFTQPPMAEAMAYRHGDFERILRPILTGDPLEVTIVGDVDEARATKVVLATLGALPPRAAGDRVRPTNPRVRYADKAPEPITVFHDGPKDRAAVLVSWPTFQWTPERRREDTVLNMAAAMLQDAVFEEIRQKLGKTYTPGVGSQTERGGDQGLLTAAIETTPDAAKTVAAAVRAISLDFARGRISEEALERVRKPLLDSEAKAKTDNSWWLDALDGTYLHPDRLERMRVWDRDIRSITLDEVRAEARRWLTADPIVVYALPCAEARPCHRELEQAGGAAETAGR